jgi:hypothetical protein
MSPRPASCAVWNRVSVASRSLQVKSRWPISPAGAPALIAMDREHRRLFVTGREPAMMVVMNAENGKVIQSFPISAGADADVYDPTTGPIFVSTREGVGFTCFMKTLLIDIPRSRRSRPSLARRRWLRSKNELHLRGYCEVQARRSSDKRKCPHAADSNAWNFSSACLFAIAQRPSLANVSSLQSESREGSTVRPVPPHL